MNILVLIAGVHDPKWPVAPIGKEAPPPSDHQIMSPFDEAALEMALRVRDADPETKIAVRVLGCAAGIKLARSAMALNISDVATIDLDRQWDQLATARALAPLCASADVILIGREFGDYDDGLIPSALAGMVDLPFFSRAQTIEPGSTLRFSREGDMRTETYTLKGPTLVSATNDRRTRLRKPLMKNVMMARNAEIGAHPCPTALTTELTLTNATPRTSARSQTHCKMLAGEPAKQAQMLASLLWEARG